MSFVKRYCHIYLSIPYTSFTIQAIHFFYFLYIIMIFAIGVFNLQRIFSSLQVHKVRYLRGR